MGGAVVDPLTVPERDDTPGKVHTVVTAQQVQFRACPACHPVRKTSTICSCSGRCWPAALFASLRESSGASCALRGGCLASGKWHRGLVPLMTAAATRGRMGDTDRGRSLRRWTHWRNRNAWPNGRSARFSAQIYPRARRLRFSGCSGTSSGLINAPHSERRGQP